MPTTTVFDWLRQLARSSAVQVREFFRKPAVHQLFQRVTRLLEQFFKLTVKCLVFVLNTFRRWIQSEKFRSLLRKAQQYLRTGLTRFRNAVVSVYETDAAQKCGQSIMDIGNLLAGWIANRLRSISSQPQFVKLWHWLSTWLQRFWLFVGSNRRLSAVILFVVILMFFWGGETLLNPIPTDLVELPKTEKIPRTIPTEMPNFSQIAAGIERKTAFFNYFLPLIEQKNDSIRDARQLLMQHNRNRASIGRGDEEGILRLAKDYRLDNFDIDSDQNWESLLTRVNTVPASLALAQAANESAWGTSRFAREGNNFYGQWCFRTGCGLVPARRESGKNHEVAAFDTPSESVNKYIDNLNTHRAYRLLREIRKKLATASKTITGYELAAGLDKYSERGQEYISELRSMIRYNKLAAYDAR